MDNCCDLGSSSKRMLSLVDGSWQSPQTQPDESTSLLVQEMNGLSVEEREGVYEEIHGVNENEAETPELVAKSLAELKQALHDLPRTKRRIYDKLLFLRPGLEEDYKFMLLFLRAAGFNIKSSVRKICRHLECKLELFGEAKLASDITIDDLSEADLVEMRAGGIRLLGRDRSRRQVWLVDMRCMLCQYWPGLQRSLWYLGMDALRSEETQLTGSVYVVCCVGLGGRYGIFKDFLMAGSLLSDAIPNRDRAFHFAYDDPSMRPLLSLIQLAIGKDLRLRFRLHFGSELELKYALLSYGISLDGSHLENSNHLKNAGYVESYILEARERDKEHRRKMKQLEEETGLITAPTPEDCLIGRGKSYQEYCGNVKFATLVDEYSERYGMSSERLDKTVTAWHVIDRVKGNGGRFLQRVSNGWKVASADTTQLKVSQALRFRVRNAENEGLQRKSGQLEDPENASSSALPLRDAKRMRLEQ